MPPSPPFSASDGLPYVPLAMREIHTASPERADEETAAGVKTGEAPSPLFLPAALMNVENNSAVASVSMLNPVRDHLELEMPNFPSFEDWEKERWQLIVQLQSLQWQDICTCLTLLEPTTRTTSAPLANKLKASLLEVVTSVTRVADAAMLHKLCSVVQRAVGFH